VYAAVAVQGIVRDPHGAAVRDADVVIATPERAFRHAGTKSFGF
jgi:hypothetical protein